MKVSLKSLHCPFSGHRKIFRRRAFVISLWREKLCYFSRISFKIKKEKKSCGVTVYSCYNVNDNRQSIILYHPIILLKKKKNNNCGVSGIKRISRCCYSIYIILIFNFKVIIAWSCHVLFLTQRVECYCLAKTLFFDRKCRFYFFFSINKQSSLWRRIKLH